MRPHLRWLMPACLALFAPGAAFSGQPAIVIVAPTVTLAWHQPTGVFAPPAATSRVVITVNPPWAVHAPQHRTHRRWQGHGVGHRHFPRHHHGDGPVIHGYRPDRHIHGPDRLGWR